MLSAKMTPLQKTAMFSSAGADSAEARVLRRRRRPEHPDRNLRYVRLWEPGSFKGSSHPLSSRPGMKDPSQRIHPFDFASHQERNFVSVIGPMNSQIDVRMLHGIFVFFITRRIMNAYFCSVRGKRNVHSHLAKGGRSLKWRFATATTTTSTSMCHTIWIITLL